MGKEKGNAKGKAPVRDPSPVPEREEASEPETTEPPTPEPQKYTKAGIVMQNLRANYPAIDKYGLIHRDQWADRKRLLEEGTLQPPPKVPKVEVPKVETKKPTTIKLTSTRKAKETTPEKVAQETEDKLQDRKVLDRMDNVRKQLVSLRDIVAGEEQEALDGVQETLEYAISQILEFTGTLKADDVDNLSSPFILLSP